MSATNVTGLTTGLYIVDSNNDRVASDSTWWAVGAFSSGLPDFDNDSMSSILGDFTIASTISSVTEPFAGENGFFDSNLTGNDVTYDGGPAGGSGPFSGQTMYLIIGDASDITSSDNIAILSTGLSFVDVPALPDLPPDQSVLLTSTTQVLYGITRDVGPSSQAPGFSVNQSVQLIPEPSAALLGALGSLLLLRRRRSA